MREITARPHACYADDQSSEVIGLGASIEAEKKLEMELMYSCRIG